MYLNAKEKIILLWVILVSIVTGFFGMISLFFAFIFMSIYHYLEKFYNYVRSKRCR